VARSNGAIEVWLCDTWSQVVVIPGNKNAPARNIFWLEQGTDSQSECNLLYSGGKKRRLISTGLNGQVIEWNLLDGSIR